MIVLTDEEILREYLPKFLGFAIMKLGHTADAEDLAQQIALELWRTLRSGRPIENTGALSWSIAQHVWCHHLRQKQHERTEYLAETLWSAENTEELLLEKEERDLLHRELAFLSARARLVTIRYYYDGKSCTDIAAELKMPVGTVKWWLYEARNSIRKGFTNMRTFGERSYRPGRLTLSCQGTPGLNHEPMSCARSKIAQNVLLAAYRHPCTPEELCEETGVPAAYIEDETAYLIDNHLLASLPGGRVQTDFIILPNHLSPVVSDQIYEACFPGFFHALMDFLEAHRDQLTDGEMNTAGFSWQRLLWVYLHIFPAEVQMRFRAGECGAVSGERIPLRPNGGRWIALGFANDSDSRCIPTVTPREYHAWDGVVDRPGSVAAQGFFHHWSGDSSAFFSLPDDVWELAAKIAAGRCVPQNLMEQDKQTFSLALEHKLFLRTENGFAGNFFFLPRAKTEELGSLMPEFYPIALPYFQRAWQIIREVYDAEIPPRLHWQMGNFLANELGVFVTASMYEGVRTGLLATPSPDQRPWLSLVVTA